MTPQDIIRKGKRVTSTGPATARPLAENSDIAFIGDTRGRAFKIEGPLARSWLIEPLNPNGRPNSDVLSPSISGLEIARRSRDIWIIDFGWASSEAESVLYQRPFRHVLEAVRPERGGDHGLAYRINWWRHVEPSPARRAAFGQREQRGSLRRFIATPTLGRDRIFAWLDARVQPDQQLIAIARDDDTTFGILHSRFLEAWSPRPGTWLGAGNDPRDTPATTFETFPFPNGLTPDIPAGDYESDPHAKRIAAAARRVDQLRSAWLNPPDLVGSVPEIVPTAAPGEEARLYPDRILPISAAAATKLKDRTLANLYAERPGWLTDAHDELDHAVAAAYGWPEDIATADALARLLTLNLERAAAQ